MTLIQFNSTDHWMTFKQLCKLEAPLSTIVLGCKFFLGAFVFSPDPSSAWMRESILVVSLIRDPTHVLPCFFSTFLLKLFHTRFWASKDLNLGGVSSILWLFVASISHNLTFYCLIAKRDASISRKYLCSIILFCCSAIFGPILHCRIYWIISHNIFFF